METLRLHAPVPATLPRTAPGGTVLEGWVVPDGVVVGTQAFTFHRDPNVWQDPLDFKPERWKNPTQEMKEYFQAFGGMARTCVDQNVARLELLHAAFLFFKEMPNAKLVDTVTEESMDFFDYFVIKPNGGKCEITLQGS